MLLIASDCSRRGRCFLLERSRVVRQSPGERNFHVFYALLGGAPAARLTELSLRTGVGAHAIAPGDVGSLAAQTHTEMEADLQACGLAFVDVSKVLAAILHLGDVKLDDPSEAGAAPVARRRTASSPSQIEGAQSKAALICAATLLGVNQKLLEQKLTTRMICVPGEPEVVVPLPPSEARSERDAIAKIVYQRLFYLLVHELLTVLGHAGGAKGGGGGGGGEARADTRRIGLLDIFGFESLATNSLEQICINFANERLHQLFVSHVFEGCPAELLPVLRDANAVGSIDNSGCVALISSPPNGILDLLDHQCRVGKRAAESAFFMAVNKQHSIKDSRYCSAPRRSKTQPHDASSGFIVKHFAGDVLYTAGSWLVTNNDSLQNPTWLKKASNPLVAKLFSMAELQPASQQSKAGASFASVGGRFAKDLSALIEQLEEQQTSFIRCVKPNLQKLPRHFDPQCVPLSQPLPQPLGLVPCPLIDGSPLAPPCPLVHRYVRSRVRAAGTLAALRFTKRMNLLVVIKLRSLHRLKDQGVLPEPLRAAGAAGAGATPEAELEAFARRLLLACGLPTSSFRFSADAVQVASPDMLFLSELEGKPGGADADAKVAAELAKRVSLIAADAAADAAAATLSATGSTTKVSGWKLHRGRIILAARARILFSTRHLPDVRARLPSPSVAPPSFPFAFH